MIDLKQIEAFYPDFLRSRKRNLLREYLQYKVLEILYDSEFATGLSFMGGTAIRMLYGSERFSEDLDFDNLNLSVKDFTALSRLLEQRLSLEGYTVEADNVFKGAFRCHLRFRNILYQSGLSGHKEEKLFIQLDTEPQRFRYEPNKAVLNKFDVFLRIQAVPPDLLLAQKILCLFKRPRPMGRDFYDVVFLAGRTQPNLNYLKAKLKIRDLKELKELLLKRCDRLDFNRLAEDVGPFLFSARDKKKVLFFRDFIKTHPL